MPLPRAGATGLVRAMASQRPEPRTPAISGEATAPVLLKHLVDVMADPALSPPDALTPPERDA